MRGLNGQLENGIMVTRCATCGYVLNTKTWKIIKVHLDLCSIREKQYLLACKRCTQ